MGLEDEGDHAWKREKCILSSLVSEYYILCRGVAHPRRTSEKDLQPELFISI